MSNTSQAIPGPRRPLSESLTFDATLSFQVTMTRSELAATRRRMVQNAIASGHETATEEWFADQDVVEYNIYEWIASGNQVGTVTPKETTVWTA